MTEKAKIEIGYEIPDHMVLTEKAALALLLLKREKVVYLQFDDGTDDHETRKQFKALTEEDGWDIGVKLLFPDKNDEHRAYLIDTGRVKEVRY